MEYVYKFWSVENRKGNGQVATSIFHSEYPEYNKIQAVYGARVSRPKDRKKYTVNCYISKDGQALFIGDIEIVNGHIVNWDLYNEGEIEEYYS